MPLGAASGSNTAVVERTCDRVQSICACAADCRYHWQERSHELVSRSFLNAPANGARGLMGADASTSGMGARSCVMKGRITRRSKMTFKSWPTKKPQIALIRGS